MKIWRVVAATALAGLGCNAKTTGPTPGVSSHCTVTLSGAVSGTYNCSPATTTWSAFDNTGGFTFAVQPSGATPTVGVAILWLGEPTDTVTYRNTDVSAQATIYVTNASSQTWQAIIGGGPPPAGSYSLHFTSVVNNLTTADGKGYSTDGTATATLPAVSGTGATGTITMTVDF